MAATLTLSPSTVTPGATFTASGTAERKGGASTSCRILVENVVKATFAVGWKGKYSRQITAPTGADRTVQVLFQQLQGTGQWATTAPARTLTIQGSVPAPQPTIPTVPLSLSGVAGNTTVALSWSAPSSNGGSALTGYIVYKNGVELANVAAGTTTYTAVGLVNNTDYQFSVAAKNAIGTGPQTSPPITVRPVAPGDTTAPVVNNIAHSSVDQDSAIVSWTLNEGATGRVRYGFSPTALTLLTILEPTYLLGHVQNVSGLTAGTPYHYQAFGADAAGNPYASAVQSFTTASVPAPPPPPPPPPPSGYVYGPGIGFETKSNHPIGGLGPAKTSKRWKASQTSTITSFSVNMRWGPGGYSAGDGGAYRATVHADNGGVPATAVLATRDFTPVQTAELEARIHYTFSSPPAVVAGNVYHLVIQNIHADKINNWMSANDVLEWGSPTDPTRGLDDSFRVLYANPNWALVTGETPVFDILYANGSHDGNKYYEIIPTSHALISGTSLMARCRFTVTGGNKVVGGIKIKVRRNNSGTSPLIIRLENGDGSPIESVSVPAAGINIVAPTEAGSSAVVTWVTATFLSARTLVNGTYNIRLSTAAGTQYSVSALRWNDSSSNGQMGAWDGYRFRNGAGSNGGSGQKTTDGTNWVDLYTYDQTDIGFYFF